MDIDAYRNFGIFTTRSKLERFEGLCKQIGVQPEFMLEMFISDLCDSYWYEEQGLDRCELPELSDAARNYYESCQVICRRTAGNLKDWAK